MKPQIAIPEVRELTGDEAEEVMRQFAPTEPAPLDEPDFYASLAWPAVPKSW